ncbi:MAG: tyrosine-type recombinase/integrase [Azoarcus sp.]|jgi:integrase|nr:tyrosine-type recombinase/integrase [Azoarcus sp.]
MRQKLTKTGILGIKLPPKGKRVKVYDTEIPKLAVQITSTGSRSFYVIKRIGATTAWLRLGAFPEMTVEQAREQAQVIMGKFAAGEDPQEERRGLRKELTLDELFKIYGERHGKKKSSWSDDVQRYSDYWKPTLGKTKLNEITRTMIGQVLAAAEKKGVRKTNGSKKPGGLKPSTVMKIRALLRHMLHMAQNWGFVEFNQAQGVTVTGGRNKRTRFLRPNEVENFFDSVMQEDPTHRDYLLMALFTGARRANVCKMHWREIDLQAREWRIPNTKNGTSQIVTLCPEAVAILEARQAETSGSYVFPPRQRSNCKSEHLVEPTTIMKRVVERAGLIYGRDKEGGIVLHDLRRTLGSWQARTGASLPIIGKALNHKSIQSTVIYAQLDTDPVRKSVETATSAMLVAAGLKKGGEVVKFTRRK